MKTAYGSDDVISSAMGTPVHEMAWSVNMYSSLSISATISATTSATKLLFSSEDTSCRRFCASIASFAALIASRSSALSCANDESTPSFVAAALGAAPGPAARRMGYPEESTCKPSMAGSIHPPPSSNGSPPPSPIASSSSSISPSAPGLRMIARLARYVRTRRMICTVTKWFHELVGSAAKYSSARGYNMPGPVRAGRDVCGALMTPPWRVPSGNMYGGSTHSNWGTASLMGKWLVMYGSPLAS